MGRELTPDVLVFASEMGKRRLSLEELGFEVVDVPRPRAGAHNDPTHCPRCAQPLLEVQTEYEEWMAPDGVSHLRFELRKGHCQDCGWLDV